MSITWHGMYDTSRQLQCEQISIQVHTDKPASVQDTSRRLCAHSRVQLHTRRAAGTTRAARAVDTCTLCAAVLARRIRVARDT